MKFKNPIEYIKDFMRDIWARLGAVFLAVIIWFFVSVTLYPEITTHVSNVKVNIDLSDSYVSNLGLSVVSGENQKVTATITGKRYEIGNLSSDDFNATVALDSVTSAGNYELKVTVAPKDLAVDCTVTKVYPSTIKVQFDRVITKTFDMTPEASKATVEDGYMIDTLECSPATVKITGSETEINKIDKCVAMAEVDTKLSETTTSTAKLVLYDSDNNKLDFSDLTYSTTDFTVNIPVYKTKTVPVKVSFRNIPSGFSIDNLKYTLSAKTIDVASTDDVIDKIDKLSLSYVDLRTVGIGSVFTLPVTMPSGVKNISGIENIEVTFDGTGYVSKQFTIADISIKNAPSDYDVSLYTSRIPQVTIIGPESVMQELTVQDIVAEIDLSTATLNEGTQKVAVSIYIPDKGAVWANGEYSAVIFANSNS